MLQAQAISLVRGTTRLVEGLSFSLAAGQALMLSAPNGAGKTTLLRVMAGLAPPETGQVLWRGEPLATSTTFKHELLWCSHLSQLKGELTTQENLAILLSFDGTTASPSEQLAALVSVGLKQRRDLPAQQLSQGQRRRIHLARLALALAQGERDGTHRRLWLLDEPGNSLDAEGTQQLAQLLSQQLARGGSALFATHLPIDCVGKVTTLNLLPPTNSRAKNHAEAQPAFAA